MIVTEDELVLSTLFSLLNNSDVFAQSLLLFLGPYSILQFFFILGLINIQITFKVSRLNFI